MIVVTTIISASMRDAVKAAIDAGKKPTILKQHSKGQVDGAYRDFFYRGRIYVATDTVVNDLESMNAILSEYPEAEIIGAWDYDTGELVQGGSHANHIDLMPDVVSYNASGVETGRVRQTVISDTHLYAGQAKRIFI